MNVLKRLLNLKDPEEGYSFADMDAKSLAKQGSATNEVVPCNLSQTEIDVLKEKMLYFKGQVEESQALCFCLAFNVQRLQKLFTGLPLDANAADDVVQDLWRKFNSSKTQESILKYEFEEKRRLLKHLRRELEQARREWKNLKIRISAPSQDDKASEDNEWSEGSDFNSPLDSDSAVHSDGDESSSSENLSVFDSRSQQLDVLEKQCLEFVSQMISREVSSQADSPVEEDIESQVEGFNESRVFHSPISIPVQLLVDVLTGTDDDDDEDEEESGSPVLEEEDDIDSEDGQFLSNDMNDSVMSSSIMTTTTASSSSQLTLLTPDILLTSAEPVEDATGHASSSNPLIRSRASSRSSPTDEEDEETRLREESLAETGEPLVLCRLRRRAVEVLVSRLREEKAFHESREKELEQKLSQSLRLNQQLRQQILSLSRDKKNELSVLFQDLPSGSWMTQTNGRRMFCLGVGFALLALNVFYGMKLLT